MAIPKTASRETASAIQGELCEIIPASPYYSRMIVALDNTHLEIEASFMAEILKTLKSQKKDLDVTARLLAQVSAELVEIKKGSQP